MFTNVKLEFEICHDWCHVNMRKMLKQNIKVRKWQDIPNKARYF